MLISILSELIISYANGLLTIIVINIITEAYSYIILEKSNIMMKR